MTASQSAAAKAVLRAEGVSKRYRIGAPYVPPASRVHAVARWLGRPLRRAAAVLQGRLAESSEQELWALRDVSFEVRQGEILGLLGVNGAGKTTLLRLASGITRPTTGRIGIRGRVGSLLEVSIGFHPELTGRENIHLFGAMLGLTPAFVAERFDSIVSFAGVERFLDTQMKFYSTGMYTRLAFAVAAELAPDLLLVDEVLSVSDVGFQQRSLATIQRRAEQGATVLFVSHNLHAMAALCTRCLLLDGGRLVADGAPPDVLRRYRTLLEQEGGKAQRLPDPDLRPGTGRARILGAVLQMDETPDSASGPHGMVRLRIRYAVHEPLSALALALAIRGPGGDLLGSARHALPEACLAPGEHRVTLALPRPAIRPGEYPLVVWLGVPGQETCDRVDQGLPSLVVDSSGETEAGAFDPLLPEGPMRLGTDLQVEPAGERSKTA